MKRRIGYAAFFGVWLMVLALVVAFRLYRERHLPTPRAAVAILRPADDMDALVARYKAKHQIVLEVIARRTTLLAAAAEFRRLDDQDFVHRPYFGPVSEDEAYCRSVMDWVKMAALPEQADELTNRLEKELLALFGKESCSCQKRRPPIR